MLLQDIFTLLKSHKEVKSLGLMYNVICVEQTQCETNYKMQGIITRN